MGGRTDAPLFVHARQQPDGGNASIDRPPLQPGDEGGSHALPLVVACDGRAGDFDALGRGAR
jgi:hypothetical protein